MTSFLTQMAMTDQESRALQQEQEDREWELLKRKQEQAKLDEEAYLRPFRLEATKNQIEDAAKKRLDDQEAERIQQWAKPLQPQLSANADGTRTMDVQTPMGPAMAGMFAAGLGTMGNDLGEFMRPFDGQSIVNSRTYNTPDELVKKAQLEEEHKRKLELEKTRIEGRQKAGVGRSGAAGNSRASSATAFRPTAFDTRFLKDLDAITETEVARAYMENNKKLLTPEETLALKTRIANQLLASPVYSAVSPQIRQSFSPAATQKPTPAPEPVTQPMSPEEEQRILQQHLIDTGQAPQTANLQEKQGATVPMEDMQFQLRNGDPVAAPQITPPTSPGFVENYTNLKPNSWLMNLFRLSQNPPIFNYGKTGNSSGIPHGNSDVYRSY